jgi:hypothetical protein
VVESLSTCLNSTAFTYNLVHYLYIFQQDLNFEEQNAWLLWFPGYVQFVQWKFKALIQEALNLSHVAFLDFWS